MPLVGLPEPGVEQRGEGRHDALCAETVQHLGPCALADADDGEPGSMSRSDPRRGVRQRDRLRGMDPQVAAGGEQYIRGGA